MNEVETLEYPPIDCALCGVDLSAVKQANNGHPLTEGWVCDTCNMDKVVPARLGLARKSKLLNDEEMKMKLLNSNADNQDVWDFFKDMVSRQVDSGKCDYNTADILVSTIKDWRVKAAEDKVNERIEELEEEVGYLQEKIDEARCALD